MALILHSYGSHMADKADVADNDRGPFKMTREGRETVSRIALCSRKKWEMTRNDIHSLELNKRGNNTSNLTFMTEYNKVDFKWHCHQRSLG